ncbi:MAG TPA: MBL fold metallo-hydrolase [Planctomycetota bacterium]|nr:MBL fold metallo-hydrolase [Planctomycetota bacterium]
MAPTGPEERLYFRQLLAGRDFAVGDEVAKQMVNFCYLIGDAKSHEVVLVDPCYAVSELVDLAERDGMKVTGVLATHYHPDHVGGDLFGQQLEGVRELLARCPCKVHVQRPEVPWVKHMTGCSDSDLAVHESGDVVKVGEIPIQLIHTPGHTPGSQCFLVQNRLVAGDTLFLQGCGRTDLPGGDARQLYMSLTQKLAHVPDGAVLYPGHLYDPRPSGSMGETRRSNAVFKPKTEREWLQMFGRG